jgi:parallel beta-helix repeat protein
VFFDDGLFVSDSYLNAVVDNLVNGKPLVYLEDVSNVSVGEAGQVILVNCSSIKVKNQNLSHTTVGVELWGANNTTVCGNNITNNHYGIYLGNSSNNNIYHNNFVNNIEKVYETYYSINNKRDDGYPSGGNYWSDYTSVDVKKGPYQDETGSDGVGDTPYYGDHYPLMNPWPSGFSLHELEVTLSVLTLLPLGNLTSIEAAVTNNGINIEQSVTISLFVNNTIVNSTIISVLEDGSFYTITYPWTPTAKGIYNITAYVNPVSGETSIENNQETEFVSISPPPEVGVKVGDWIRYEYTITGAPSGTTPPTWIKAEFLTVEGANATVRITMHMSDGTEQNQTVTMDIASGGGSLYTFSGFVVCSNCTTGDSVYISGYGNVTIAGETTRTCAGAGRTVIYASFSQYGTQLTYYWDKLTGVMVEASVVSGAMTGTAKATETNMWQASSSGFPIEPIYLYVLAALVMVMAVGAVVFILRRRKKQTEATIPETDRHE